MKIMIWAIFLLVVGAAIFLTCRKALSFFELLKKYISLKALVLAPKRIEMLWKRELSQINKNLVAKIKRELELKNDRHLHVCFYVCEKSKWNAQSLYEELKKNQRIKISFAVGPNDEIESRKISPDRMKEVHRKNLEFYKGICPDLYNLFDVRDDQFPTTSLEQLKADIIFYQQPWGEMGDYPSKLIGRSLACYIPYSFILVDWDDAHFDRHNFSPYLWKYFSQTDLHREDQLHFDPLNFEQIEVTGYPKLDVYVNYNSEEYPRTQKTVIYAPHHSIGNSNLKLSTFDLYYKDILALAKSTPEIAWVFKPHPTLCKSVIEKKLMSESEYQAHIEAWQQLPNAKVNDSGNYFEIFKNSDALITDCASFLAEYLPTGNPIIRLTRPDSVPLNKIGEAINKTLYQAESFTSLKKHFEQLIITNEDSLKTQRAQTCKQIYSPNAKSAEIISKIIFREFNL